MATFVRVEDRIIRLPRPEFKITAVTLQSRRKNASIWVETESRKRTLLGDFPKERAKSILQAIQDALATLHIVVDARALEAR